MAYQRGRYWYRSQREGRQVRTEYLGAGPLVDALVAIGDLERQQRELLREEQRGRRAEIAALDRKVDAAGDALRLLVRACLLAHGYHTHKGQWRRRR